MHILRVSTEKYLDISYALVTEDYWEKIGGVNLGYLKCMHHENMFLAYEKTDWKTILWDIYLFYCNIFNQILRGMKNEKK